MVKIQNCRIFFPFWFSLQNCVFLFDSSGTSIWNSKFWGAQSRTWNFHDPLGPIYRLSIDEKYGKMIEQVGAKYYFVQLYTVCNRQTTYVEMLPEVQGECHFLFHYRSLCIARDIHDFVEVKHLPPSKAIYKKMYGENSKFSNFFPFLIFTWKLCFLVPFQLHIDLEQPILRCAINNLEFSWPSRSHR